MARRLFSTQIVDSDAFLDMSVSTQNLYFHLGMRADDDGFVGNPKKIMRMCGGNEDDLKVLIAKRFILTFKSGVVVIKHWLIHNSIRKDRYNPTQYLEEKSTLRLKENKSYTDDLTVGIPLGNQTATQVKLSQVKLKEDNAVLLKNYLNGDRQYKPSFSGNLIVESPAGSKKLGFWKEGEFYEFGGKLSEIEWKQS